MIFTDLSQKRWLRARLVFGLTVFCAVILLSAVIIGLVTNPPLPFWQINKANQLKSQKVSQKILKQETFEPKNHKTRFNLNKNNKSNQAININQDQTNKTNLLSTAFLEQDDQSSLDSFTQNQNTINMVFPDWYILKSNDCQVFNQEKPEITKIINQNSNIKIVPRITNSYQGIWYGPATSKLLQNQTTSDCLVKNLTNLVKSSNVAGLNIDFEDLRPEDKGNFLDFLNNLGKNLKAENKLLTVDVTINDPAYDLEYIGKVADFTVVMDYDEHYPGSTPGPIASRDWFNGVVDQAAAAIPKNKLIIGLGIYGYDWNTTSKNPADGLKFSEIMNLAKEANVDLELKSDYGYNFHFAYLDEKNKIIKFGF